jgi:hypothetical protein
MPRTPAVTRYVPKPGSIIRLAKAGDTVETVVVAATAKPAGSSFTDWKNLGCVETAAVEILTEAGEPVHCFNATSGKWEQKSTEDTDADTRLRLNIVCQEVTDFLYQLALGANSVHADTGAFVPGSLKGGAVQGWLKVQTQVGTEVVTVLDMWVEVKLSAAAKIADRTAGWKPEIVITQLGAALDAGVLGTPAA